jgi:hypothetical protein
MLRYYTTTIIMIIHWSLDASDTSLKVTERLVYPFKNFSQVVLNGAFEVFLFQGEKEEVILEGPKHLLEDITVNQRGTQVIVGDKPYKRKSIKKVAVYVYLVNLKELEINGISGLECGTTIKSTHLKLYCNGIRNVDFDLAVGDLKATFDGIGSTYLYGKVETADIES